jgi:DNA (cytosine-5)-methyltransferase 1
MRRSIRSMQPLSVPIIDLFAGPGGLAEGFTSLRDEEIAFNVAVAVEKEPAAHRTLTLRSFFRQFPRDAAPSEYYAYVRGEITRDELFRVYRRESEAALKSCLLGELGQRGHTARIVKAIAAALAGRQLWILIGGPPCQAYSIVGRSRMSSDRTREEFEADHRHYLYRQYLEIIARFKPPIFVMENVKGLLSSKISGEYIFQRMLDDLQEPGSATRSREIWGGTRYRIVPCDAMTDEPVEYRYSDYIIRAENLGVPQRRHRVILLGIRRDLEFRAAFELEPTSRTTHVCEVIDDLPELRSRLSQEEDSPEAWYEAVNETKQYLNADINSAVCRAMNLAMKAAFAHTDYGGRYVKRLKSSRMPRRLRDWYLDEALNGALNHETRLHRRDDLRRYLFVSCFGLVYKRSPKLADFPVHLLPDHENVWMARKSHELFDDRFRTQIAREPATTVTSHIAKDGHSFIHHDASQCRSWTVREAARAQSFPDNYFFEGTRTQQYVQVGNAVPPLLASSIARRIAAIIKSLVRS